MRPSLPERDALGALSVLPDELLLSIVVAAPTECLPTLARLCKAMQAICLDTAHWEQRLRREYPSVPKLPGENHRGAVLRAFVRDRALRLALPVSPHWPLCTAELFERFNAMSDDSRLATTHLQASKLDIIWAGAHSTPERFASVRHAVDGLRLTSETVIGISWIGLSRNRSNVVVTGRWWTTGWFFQLSTYCHDCGPRAQTLILLGQKPAKRSPQGRKMTLLYPAKAATV